MHQTAQPKKTIFERLEDSKKITALRKQAVEQLKMAKTYVDDRAAASAAQTAIRDLLDSLGFSDVVDALDDVLRIEA